MKTFEDYRDAILSVGESARERLLAEADRYLTPWELVRLAQIASPDAP